MEENIREEKLVHFCTRILVKNLVKKIQWDKINF